MALYVTGHITWVGMSQTTWLGMSQTTWLSMSQTTWLGMSQTTWLGMSQTMYLGMSQTTSLVYARPHDLVCARPRGLVCSRKSARPHPRMCVPPRSSMYVSNSSRPRAMMIWLVQGHVLDNVRMIMQGHVSSYKMLVMQGLRICHLQFMCGTENFCFNNSAVKSLIQFWTGRLIFCKIRGHRSSKLIITCMASDVYCMHCRVDDSKEICYPKFSENPKNFIVPPETETSVPWKSHFVWKMVVSSGDVILSFPEKVGHGQSKGTVYCIPHFLMFTIPPCAFLQPVIIMPSLRYPPCS